MVFDIKVTVVGDKKLLRTMNALKGFFRSPELRRTLDDTKNDLLRQARNLAPAASRFLKNLSLSGQVVGFGTPDVKIRVGSSARYARYVEEGTRPHKIYPKHKKSLFWVEYSNPGNQKKLGKAGAVFTFASEVDHPGTKPQPFMVPAYRIVKPRLLMALQNLVRSKMKGI